MYIKSMVVDGFKSYAQRTEINGFDRLFNAITGLNGSGKSNILDAICFLLGITNLSQVGKTLQMHTGLCIIFILPNNVINNIPGTGEELETAHPCQRNVYYFCIPVATFCKQII